MAYETTNRNEGGSGLVGVILGAAIVAIVAMFFLGVFRSPSPAPTTSVTVETQAPAATKVPPAVTAPAPKAANPAPPASLTPPPAVKTQPN